MTGYTFEEITRDKPEKSLVKGMKQKAGRNASGRMTVRRRGGGHKRRYRVIDFKRDKFWQSLLKLPQLNTIRTGQHI